MEPEQLILFVRAIFHMIFKACYDIKFFIFLFLLVLVVRGKHDFI